MREWKKALSDMIDNQTITFVAGAVVIASMTSLLIAVVIVVTPPKVLLGILGIVAGLIIYQFYVTLRKNFENNRNKGGES